MRALKALLICGTLVLAVALPAAAEPKGSGGQTCDESATGVSHKINGKNYTCDKCVYSQCDTSGGSISNCKRVTEYTNCVAAAGSSGVGPARVNVDRMEQPIAPPRKGPQQAAPQKKQQ